jgi:hypothetical protein
MMHPGGEGGMGWSWQEMTEDTPPYVRRFCTDLLMIKRKCHNAAVERAQRPRGGQV